MYAPKALVLVSRLDYFVTFRVSTNTLETSECRSRYETLRNG